MLELERAGLAERAVVWDIEEAVRFVERRLFFFIGRVTKFCTLHDSIHRDALVLIKLRRPLSCSWSRGAVAIGVTRRARGPRRRVLLDTTSQLNPSDGDLLAWSYVQLYVSGCQSYRSSNQPAPAKRAVPHPGRGSKPRDTRAVRARSGVPLSARLHGPSPVAASGGRARTAPSLRVAGTPLAESPRPRSHDVREGARGGGATRTGLVTPGTRARRPAPGSLRRRGAPTAQTKSEHSARERSRRKAASRARRARSKGTPAPSPGQPPADR